LGLRVYNTMTQRKEELIPLQGKRISMYVCGVTVYDLCHIGHARNAVVFDCIYRYLKYRGYEVTYVRNFTDVDDKIIKRANMEGTSTEEIATRYIHEFYTDMKPLNLEEPTFEPRATDHIPEMIGMIQRLLEKRHAYQIRGDIYYSVESFPDYGKLSKRSPEEMRAGARVDVDERKRNPLDFALWKSAKPSEPSWESPWGKGRPGWHIECSAMSQRYLGVTIDIHAGGKDLIFPHHENEIAQSEGATGKPFVRYWLHNGFVNIDREKMSKSLGNILTVRELLQDYHPEVMRLFLLSRHYRSPIDYSHQGMERSRQNLIRFYKALGAINEVCAKEKKVGKIINGLSPMEKDVYRRIEEFPARFQEAMDDDFNTALALAPLFELTRDLNRLLKNPTHHTPQIIGIGTDIFVETGKVLGIFQEDPKVFLEEERSKKTKTLTISQDEIERLIRERDEARRQKKWARADEIRTGLASHGIILEDTPMGTIWRIE
jgi:cysteinyl-tRNA synthetase